MCMYLGAPSVRSQMFTRCTFGVVTTSPRTSVSCVYSITDVVFSSGLRMYMTPPVTFIIHLPSYANPVYNMSTTYIFKNYVMEKIYPYHAQQTLAYCIAYHNTGRRIPDQLS